MKKILSFAFIGAALITLAACSDDTETKVLSVPSVTLFPTSVTLSHEAADNCSVAYVVTNPDSNASVFATADVSWVWNIETNGNGQIIFSVSGNNDSDPRTANLTLTYRYEGGETTAKAAVVQYGSTGPTLTVDPNAVVAGTIGGSYSFSYEIENPIDGEEVRCSADVDWLSDFNYATYGTVSFTVATSEDEELRTGTITVSYAGLTKEVTVVQDRTYIYDDTATTLSVEPNAIVAEAEGGEYSFTYTIANAIAGETVSCTADVDWLSGFDYSTDGTVSFTVAETDSHELRSGTITVSYADITKEVSVVQDRMADPVLTVNETTIKAEYMGGEYSFTYTIKNPVGGGRETVSCTADVNWLTDFDYSTDGVVSFTVAENTDYVDRTGTITVTYSDLLTKVTVEQERTTAGPVLTVTPDSFSVEVDGGKYSFTYTIENPEAGETISCTADVDWLTDFDYSTDGVVSFTVAENFVNDSRAGVITASHSGTEVTVTVEQAASSYTGTYIASGFTYFASGDAEWMLRIYEYDDTCTATTPYYDGDFDLCITGFTPRYDTLFGSYTDNTCAAGAVLSEGNIVIPTQVTTAMASGYYLGYTPCSGYNGSSFQTSGYIQYLTLTLTDSNTATWEGDFGIMLAGYTSYATSSTLGMFDAVAPKIKLVKVSNSTDYVVPTSVKPSTNVPDIIPLK